MLSAAGWVLAVRGAEPWHLLRVKRVCLKKGRKRTKRGELGTRAWMCMCWLSKNLVPDAFRSRGMTFFSPILAHKHPPLPSLFIFFETPWLEKRHLPDG